MPLFRRQAQRRHHLLWSGQMQIGAGVRPGGKPRVADDEQDSFGHHRCGRGAQDGLAGQVDL